jgi:hypothetical protein
VRGRQGEELVDHALEHVVELWPATHERRHDESADAMRRRRRRAEQREHRLRGIARRGGDASLGDL